MTLWEDIKHRTKEWAEVAIDKSQELSQIGKVKLDIINIQRKIERKFVALGGLTYQLLGKEKTSKIASNKNIKDHIEKISSLENDLNNKKNELDNIGQESSKKENINGNDKNK